MKIVGCDLHARQQSIGLLDTETGELIERTLDHEADQVREFYSSLTGPVVVGIEYSWAIRGASRMAKVVDHVARPDRLQKSSVVVDGRKGKPMRGCLITTVVLEFK
jgi:hypothetical protein